MFTWATEGRGRSVVYVDPDGNRMIRRGDTWVWRNNNPGNIKSGSKARTLGSIGRAGGFAVFPDLMTGRKALKGVLQTSYPNTTLFRLVGYYAPKGENDPKRYRKLLHDFTGLDLKRTVSPKAQDFSSIVRKDNKNVESFKENIWHHEEIHSND